MIYKYLKDQKKTVAKKMRPKSFSEFDERVPKNLSLNNYIRLMEREEKKGKFSFDKRKSDA